MTEGEAAAAATNGQTKAEEGEGEAQAQQQDGEGEAQAQQQDVDAKIVKQIEYYFGDYNLPRDKFLQQEIKNDEGWVTLDTMTKFKRLASISSDKAVIAAALRNASSSFIEVHEEGEKIRRAPTHPLPIFDDNLKEETKKRTIYCKGFAKDNSVTLDNLLEFFKEYGPYDTVLMRHFFDREAKKQGFKGSVLVVFADKEKAEAFLNLPEVKYNGTQLLRKWHNDYLEEKRKEIEERKARKEAKKKEGGGASQEVDDESRQKNRKRKAPDPTEELVKLASKRLQQPQDDSDIVAAAWAVELRKMDPQQQLFAKKAINEILFEGQMGTLHRSSVEINVSRVATPYSVQSLPSPSVPQYESASASSQHTGGYYTTLQ